MFDESTCLNICAGACVFIAIMVLRIWYEGIQIDLRLKLTHEDDLDDEDDDDWWKRPKRVED